MKTTVQAVRFVLKLSYQAAPILFSVFILATIFLSFTNILNILIFKEIVDAANNHKTFLGIGLLSFVIIRLVLEAASKIIGRYAEYVWFVFDSAATHINFSNFIKKLATFDLSNFENPTTHDMIWRAFNRLQWHLRFYLDTTIKLFSKFIELSVSVIIFAYASPISAVFIVIANVIPIYLRSILGEQNFNIYKADSETLRKYEYLQSMTVNRDSLMELKQFQGFGFLKHRLLSLYSSFTNKQLSQYRRQWLWLTMADLLPTLAIFGFLIVIVIQLSNQEITTGTFVFLFTNIFIFSGALTQLSMYLGALIGDAHFIFDAINFFKVKQNVEFPQLNQDQEKELENRLEKPTIVFENVSFRYPNTDKPVIKNITLTIPYGQNVALIGENGAGKSTLVKLFLRIYDPTEGRILINGIDLKDLTEVALFKLYSSLFQSFGKFYLTIKENLELAAGAKVSEEECIKILKLSNAWNYVKDFSKQLDQQLGPTYKDGVDLSGGQWQQLAIARALIRKTPILILDEPTSAIDAKAETEIFDRLHSSTQAKSLIFISHRFSTIKDAERIIVLDKGKIIEDGTHRQLMQNEGKYAKLYTMQADRYSRE